MASKKRTERDIAALTIYDLAGSPQQFARFCGAVEATERMGHTVNIRVIRDPNNRVHSLVASASSPSVPSTTETNDTGKEH
jgi:hypothetical protein